MKTPIARSPRLPVFPSFHILFHNVSQLPMGYRPYQILTLLYLWNRYPLQLLPIELKGPDGPLRQALFKSTGGARAASNHFAVYRLNGLPSVINFKKMFLK